MNAIAGESWVPVGEWAAASNKGARASDRRVDDDDDEGGDGEEGREEVGAEARRD